MILLALGLLLIGAGLSAFFSGSETGFYRASRVRIVMDALDGDRLSKFLLLLTNRPALFVATALIGNNLANYITSLAVVLGSRCLYPSDTASVELIAPILMSPFLYVYGESLPKNVFFMAPNRLLKISAPLLLLFTILFFPLALLLWGVAKGLEKVLGESPDKIRLVLARKELQKVLDEGEEAGILHPTQRLLAQNFFVEASKPVREVCTPLSKLTAFSKETPVAQVLKAATRKKLSDAPIFDGQKSKLIGYYRTVDLLIAPESKPELRELGSMNLNDLCGEALLQMQQNRQTLVKILNAEGEVSGLLSIDQLFNPLLKGPLLKLRR